MKEDFIPLNPEQTKTKAGRLGPLPQDHVGVQAFSHGEQGRIANPGRGKSVTIFTYVFTSVLGGRAEGGLTT